MLLRTRHDPFLPLASLAMCIMFIRVDVAYGRWRCLIATHVRKLNRIAYHARIPQQGEGCG